MDKSGFQHAGAESRMRVDRFTANGLMTGAAQERQWLKA